MKKKIIAIAAAVAILAVAIVGGTLAWLTSTDTVTNTFTVGNVQIKLDETAVDANGKATSGARVKANTFHIIPGDVVDKDPTVTVLANSEPCYVYVYIDNQLGSHATLNIDTTDWVAVDATSKAGLYQYKSIVTLSTTNTELPDVFTTVTIEGDTLDNTTLAGLAGKTVVVKAYAVQSDNVTDAQADGLAWTALHG